MRELSVFLSVIQRFIRILRVKLTHGIGKLLFFYTATPLSDIVSCSC